jgi:hypothetical protein
MVRVVAKAKASNHGSESKVRDRRLSRTAALIRHPPFQCCAFAPPVRHKCANRKWLMAMAMPLAFYYGARINGADPPAPLARH